MRTQDYLRQASENLRQAVQAYQIEIDELRRSEVRRGQELNERMSELKHRETTRLKEAYSTGSDQQTASRLYDARMLRGEESKAQHDYNRQKQIIDNRITVLERNMNSLNPIMQQLDKQISQVNPATRII